MTCSMLSPSIQAEVPSRYQRNVVFLSAAKASPSEAGGFSAEGARAAGASDIPRKAITRGASRSRDDFTMTEPHPVTVRFVRQIPSWLDGVHLQRNRTLTGCGS